jgi:hypothetical protein
MAWKVFISYASEDKASVARPLADQLGGLGYEVWFDDHTLHVGDSLRSAIDKGLAQCDHAIVIVSPSFFAKEWPQRELDALFAKEMASGDSVIIPVWHKLTAEEVLSYSPLLAGLLAADTSRGIPAVVQQIVAVLGEPKAGLQLPVKTTLNAYEEVLHLFQSRSYEGLATLAPSIRKEFENRFTEQETAIRLVLSVDKLKNLDSSDKQVVLAAFVPAVDPNALPRLHSMLDSVPEGEDLKKILDGFEILTTIPVPQRLAFEPLIGLGGPANEPVGKYVGMYHHRALVAAAISDEITAVLDLPVPGLWGALHLLAVGTCDGKELISDSIPLKNGQFRKVMRGWLVQEQLELMSQIEVVKSIEDQGLSPKTFKLPNSEEILPLFPFLLKHYNRMLDAQVSIKDTLLDIYKKSLKEFGIDYDDVYGEKS